MPVTIVSTAPLDEGHRQSIAEAAPDYRLLEVDRDDEEALLAAAPEAEIWLGGRMRPHLFAAARRLRWMQALSAGVDRYLFPAMLASEVQIANVRGMHADTMADHVFMFILALARNLRRILHLQAASTWTRQPLAELGGDTLGVIGLGGVGREVARRGRVFGMRVIGTRRSGEPVPEADATFGAGDLEHVLRESRWAVLACPLTAETRALIGRRQLDWLGGDGYLINIGRGGLVDEAALVDALREGRLAGAGLDVFAEEPLPPESPLWALPNVIVTPHVAGGLRDYMGRAVAVFCDNLRRYRRGQPLRNVVDKAAGY